MAAMTAVRHPAKWCPRCERDVSVTYFAKNSLADDGLQWVCSPCRRDQERFRLFGLTRAEFEALLDSQDGRCAICCRREPGGRSNEWHVDHCHETGVVRGLLCAGCNLGLGVYEKFARNPRVELYLCQ